MSEHDLQKDIVTWLRWVLPADQDVLAIANNPRSRISGAFEKARGMVAGEAARAACAEATKAQSTLKYQGVLPGCCACRFLFIS